MKIGAKIAAVGAGLALLFAGASSASALPILHVYHPGHHHHGFFPGHGWGYGHGWGHRWGHHWGHRWGHHW